MKLIKKFVLLSMVLGLGIGCSMSPHRKLVQENHQNNWVEKKHVYRSIASLGIPTGNPSGSPLGASAGEKNQLSIK